MVTKLLCVAVLATGLFTVPVTQGGEAERILFYRAGVVQVVLDDGSSGTAFAYADDQKRTYLLTARHVVESSDGTLATKVGIRYALGDTEVFAKALVERVSTHSDLAILSTDYHNLLPTLSLAPGSFDLKVGSAVAALGFPGGTFPCWATLGYLDESYESPYDLRTYRRHSAGAYFGNSGGPLVDYRTGKVIGITVMIEMVRGEARSDRLFAVPIDQIHRFLDCQCGSVCECSTDCRC